MKQPRLMLILLSGTLLLNGCQSDENRRLADMAERQLERQAEQNRRMADLQAEGAEPVVAPHDDLPAVVASQLLCNPLFNRPLAQQGSASPRGLTLGRVGLDLLHRPDPCESRLIGEGAERLRHPSHIRIREEVLVLLLDYLLLTVDKQDLALPSAILVSIQYEDTCRNAGSVEQVRS